MLLLFYIILSMLKHPNAILVAIGTQLNLPIEVKSRPFGVILFTSGLFVSCAFSSGLLSNLSTNQDVKISTIEEFLATIQKPYISVCLFTPSFLAMSLDKPGSSKILRALVSKQNEGKLILSNESYCLKLTEASENVISILTFRHWKPYIGHLVSGEEVLDFLTISIPMSPGYPLRRQVNKFIGSLREMHMHSEQLRRLDFNETMKKIINTRISETTKVLRLHDFASPLFIIIASWFIGSMIEIYQWIKSYKESYLIKKLKRNKVMNAM